MIIASVTIDLKKVNEKDVFIGKNGAHYYTFNIEIYDERDNWDNDVKAVKLQSKAERTAKKPKERIGYGRVFFNRGLKKYEHEKA